MHIFRWLLVLVWIILGGVSMWFTQPAYARAPLQSLADNDDWLNIARPLTQEELQGRIILLDFWTFCCINCMHVLPDLHELEEEFGNKLTVIGIHSAKFQNEKESQQIHHAIARYGITHPVINDADFTIWRQFAVRAWPSFVLIAPDGSIAARYSGEGHKEELREAIQTMIDDAGANLKQEPLPMQLAQKPDSGLLYFPGKLAYAEHIGEGGTLFVSDSGHHRILGFGLDGTLRYTIGQGTAGWKDGTLADARFRNPLGLVADGQQLFVADTQNHMLRQINIASGTVTTLAGTGKQGYDRLVLGAAARKQPLASPWDVALYPTPRHITMAMAGTHQLWVYDREEQTVSVMAGNGRESIDDGGLPLNSLSQPSGLAVRDGVLYFVDAETSSLRQFEQGKITTLVGTGLFDFGLKDGIGKEAQMQHALGVDAHADGLWIADSYNHAIRHYDIETGKLTTFAGDGTSGQTLGDAHHTRFAEPHDLLWVGDTLYVVDTNNHRIIRLDKTGKSIHWLPLANEKKAKNPPHKP